MELKALYEEMQKTWKAMQEAMDRQEGEIKQFGEASQETRTLVDKLNEKITELEAEMKALQTRANRPPVGGGEGGTKSTMTPEQKAAFIKFLRYGMTSHKAGWTPDEQKALSEMIDERGGYLVPPDFQTEILAVAQNVAQIRGVARVTNTTRAEVEFSKVTQRATIAWGNENIAVDPQDLKLGLESIPVNEMTALVLIPNSLLEDEAADIWGELTTIFGQDIAAAEDDAFATGNGVKRPEGVLANKEVQAGAIKSGNASDITNPDVLLDALYGLKVTYRRNAVWAMNSLTEAQIRKMKDSMGQYLWAPGLSPDRPATLLGRPVINPEGMPDVAANSLPIVVGDFGSGYRIVDRRGMTIQRLVERYAEFRQTGFLVTKRVGGQVVLPEAFKAIRISA